VPVGTKGEGKCTGQLEKKVKLRGKTYIYKARKGDTPLPLPESSEGHLALERGYLFVEEKSIAGRFPKMRAVS